MHMHMQCVLLYYSNSDNAMGSPDYFIDYADEKGPNESHKWLMDHPFY